MNTLKKTTLVIALLIPTNGIFAGVSDWYNSGKKHAKDGVTSIWNYISSNAKGAYQYSKNTTIKATKATCNKIKNNPIKTAAGCATTGMVLYLLGKNKNKISNFGKNQLANTYNKYSSLKDKLNNLNKDEKAKIKKTAKITAAGTATVATGIAAYYLYKTFFATPVLPGDTSSIPASEEQN